MIELKELKEPGELELWDDFVESGRFGTVYHLSGFQDLIESAFSLEKCMMGIYREKELIGVIPLFFQNDSLPKVLWSPYDRVRYGGPVLAEGLGEEPELIGNIIKQLVGLSLRLGAECVAVSPPVGTTYGKIFKTLGFTRINMVTPMLDLRKDEKELWEGMNRKCRNAVRKAQKSGVNIVDMTGRNWVDAYWEMLLDTFSNKEISPVFPEKFYRKLEGALGPDKIRVYFAELDGRSVAGSVFLAIGDCVYYQDNASLAAFHGYAPNNLIQWEFIRWARKKGFKRYDLIGGMVPSITRFKLGFGAELAHHERWYRNLHPKIGGKP